MILKSKECYKENNLTYNAQDQDQKIKIMLIYYLYGHHYPLPTKDIYKPNPPKHFIYKAKKVPSQKII